MMTNEKKWIVRFEGEIKISGGMQDGEIEEELNTLGISNVKNISRRRNHQKCIKCGVIVQPGSKPKCYKCWVEDMFGSD